MVDEKAIRERAYHIWVAEGRPHGRDREHWERASREIEADMKVKPAKAVAKPKPAGKAKPRANNNCYRPSVRPSRLASLAP